MLDYKNYINNFNNVNHFPERMAKGLCEGLERDLENFKAKQREKVKYDWQKEKLEEFFKLKKEMYFRLCKDYLRSYSSCTSSMITGRANYNVRRADKANVSNHNKLIKLNEQLRTWDRMIDKMLERGKTLDNLKDEFTQEVIRDYQDGLKDFNRALLKGKLERRAKHHDISKTIDYIRENISRFKMTERSLDKISQIKKTSEKLGLIHFNISKEDYFNNRLLVKSLGFKWNTYEKKWFGTQEMINKYNQEKGEV